MNTQRSEHISLAVGLTLLAMWAGARFHGSMASRAAIERFQANTAAVPETVNSAPAVDFTQWDSKRVVAYKDSLAAKTDLSLAILRIPKINLAVPAFNDTDARS
jgi:hypothetical protein